MQPSTMRPVGKQYRQPYDVRLSAVRRYLNGNETAAQVGASIGVSEPTMRRYVRELRGTVQEDISPANSTNGSVYAVQHPVEPWSIGGSA